MIRFLKDRMSSISSDLYEEMLQPNKSHTNRIIQIVPCKTALRTPFFTEHLWATASAFKYDRLHVI